MKTLRLSEINAFNEGYIDSNFLGQVAKLTLVLFQRIYCFVIIFLTLFYNILLSKSRSGFSSNRPHNHSTSQCPSLAAYYSVIRKLFL